MHRHQMIKRFLTKSGWFYIIKNVIQRSHWLNSYKRGKCTDSIYVVLLWTSNHIPNRVQNEITFSVPNFNDCTVEVWVWISIFIPHFIMQLFIHSRIKLYQFLRRASYRKYTYITLSSVFSKITNRCHHVGHIPILLVPDIVYGLRLSTLCCIGCKTKHYHIILTRLNDFQRLWQMAVSQGASFTLETPFTNME